LKTETIVLFVQFAPLTRSVEREPEFQVSACFSLQISGFSLRLHHLKSFGSGSRRPKLVGLRFHSPAGDTIFISCVEPTPPA